MELVKSNNQLIEFTADQEALIKKQERWLPVVGFEGLYEVSDFGRVRSLDKEFNTGFGKVAKKGRIMRLKLEKTGYPRVKLCKNGTSKHCNVHRLVAEAFLPNPENKRTVNHKDSNRANNLLSNLEWATNSENQIHSFQMGRVNEGAPRKLTALQEDDVLMLLSMGMKQWKVAEMYGVSQPTISNILKQRR
jgi:hypothetical protein